MDMEIRQIRTENLKQDYRVYRKIRVNRDEPEMSFMEWAEWVWSRHQQNRTSVFCGMPFEEYVAI